MARPKTQKAITQSRTSSSTARLPLAISNKPLPELDSPYHVLVRVLAVGLNPTDHKMVTNFYMENNTVGCDFCGIVEDAGRESTVAVGTRVIGADFPYRPNNPLNGAFAEYAVCDSRQTLKVPKTWSDTQAAALGAIGFGTACLAISDPDALNLDGLPSKPVAKAIPVLVHGGASATGLVAIQMLQRLVLHAG
jgi:NADPH:quinone reductase-like Zn-dependent oxidoreductase